MNRWAFRHPWLFAALTGVLTATAAAEWAWTLR